MARIRPDASPYPTLRERYAHKKNAPDISGTYHRSFFDIAVEIVVPLRSLTMRKKFREKRKKPKLHAQKASLHSTPLPRPAAPAPFRTTPTTTSGGQSTRARRLLRRPGGTGDHRLGSRTSEPKAGGNSGANGLSHTKPIGGRGWNLDISIPPDVHSPSEFWRPWSVRTCP